MHSIHERYVSTPPSPSLTTFANYLSAVEQLDELERDRILATTLMFFDFGNYLFSDEPSLEDASRQRWDEFKAKCRKLIEADMTEDFLVFGLVNYTLTTLLSYSSRSVESERERLRRWLDYLKRSPNEAVENEFFGDKDSQCRQTEEQINNLVGDLELSQRAYRQFCETVVSRLLP